MYAVIHNSTGIVAAQFQSRSQALYWAETNNTLPQGRTAAQVSSDALLEALPANLYRVEKIVN